MRKSKILILALSFSFILSSCSALGNLGLKPSMLETISAVKDLMNSSVFKALLKLQNLNANGVESVLPKEIQPVLATLKTLGLGNEVDKVSKSIGDASSIVLKESSSLFADAIKEVDLGDAVAIVLGGEDAATQVLKNALKVAVKKRYSAALNTQLNKTDANKYWPMASNAYNLFSKNKIDTNLSDMLAEKAVDGVFLAMGKEEAQLRKDPVSIGSAVASKVWDYYSKNKQ
jgi:hypothetical protein